MFENRSVSLLNDKAKQPGTALSNDGFIANDPIQLDDCLRYRVGLFYAELRSNVYLEAIA